MGSSPNPWPEYKQAILDAREDFSWIYQDLKGVKSSSNGWVTALCPFHQDRNPSFAFEKATGNWKCQAGCDSGSVFDYIARTREVSFKDAMVVLGEELGVEKPAGRTGSRVTFDYLDEAGELLYQVVKSPGKKFWQRRPDGRGGWVNSLKGVDRVLYNLPDLIARTDESVYITEGEKDADLLAGFGLLATTNSGGAGKWLDPFSDTLVGRDIVILPDNDTPGRDHAQQVARSFTGKSGSVKIIELPDLPEKGDVSDWIARGGTKDHLLALAADTVVWEPQAEPDGRHQVQLYENHLQDVLAETWRLIFASNDPPHLFISAGGLARIVTNDDTPSIELLNEAKAYGILIRLADWYTQRGQKDIVAKPPKEVARDILANPRKDLPALDSIISTPAFDKDWRLLTKPGYHPEAALWLHQKEGAKEHSVPMYPTQEDVLKARSLILDDLLVDFPFTAESDRAHAVAALLLPFARRMFAGPTPLHLIEAPTPGSGKSLLAELVSIVALGTSPGATTLTANEEESRKKLTAILSRGTPVISIDNLQGGLWSAQVAAAVTAEIWEDRILGQTQMVSFPNRALWLVSANNPKLSMEIARRCVRIRIDAGEEKPWQRTGFKHDPIRDWVKQNRYELVQAVLTLIQSWIVAGSPLADQTMGSFEAWSRIIGGMVQHMGLTGFLDNTDEFYEAADSESGEWQAFINAWHAEFQGTPVEARQLMTLAVGQELVPFAYAARSEHAQKVRFGKSLSSLRDRKFGEFKVSVSTDTHKKTKTYRLVPVEVGLFK